MKERSRQKVVKTQNVRKAKVDRTNIPAGCQTQILRFICVVLEKRHRLLERKLCRRK